MPYYRAVGEIPRKRHTQFRKPNGRLYAEELMGMEGFSAESALLYHEGLPTAVVDIKPWEKPEERTRPNYPLRPRHFATHKLSTHQLGTNQLGTNQLGQGGPTDVVTGRQLLLANDDVRISYAVADAASPLYRNATGDECVYLESGWATLETIFGTLDVGQGDYVVLPKSTTHRWVPTVAAADHSTQPLRVLTVEARGHIGPPKRYLTARGQFNEFSPYCERDLRVPNAPHRVTGQDVDVLVRHSRGDTRLTYATHPFDVVGWDGCVYPYAFNIADFEPITGRLHQPPPVHQTFAGPRFVICSFVPRTCDYHPLSVPAPYNHANTDSDELLFYAGGEFMSRKGAGIELGSMTLHPSGFTHGPHPGSVEASLGKEETDELAVMIDTCGPLEIGDSAFACEETSYAWSWSGRHRDSGD